MLLVAGSKSWDRLRAMDIASSAGVRYLITSSALTDGSMRLPTRISNGSLNIARNLASAALTVGWAMNSFSAARVRLRSCIRASNTTIRLISALRSSFRFIGAPGAMLVLRVNCSIDSNPDPVKGADLYRQCWQPTFQSPNQAALPQTTQSGYPFHSSLPASPAVHRPGVDSRSGHS